MPARQRAEGKEQRKPRKVAVMSTSPVRLACIACVLLGSVAVGAQQKPQSQLRGFSVVLVQGDQQEGSSSDLPPAARSRDWRHQGLPAVQELPPARFLVDAGLERGAGGPRADSAVTARTTRSRLNRRSRTPHHG